LAFVGRIALDAPLGKAITNERSHLAMPRFGGRIAKLAIAVVAIFLIVFSGIYTVGDQERAVITTFGKYTSTQGAGLHFRFPFFQQCEKVSMITNGFTIGWQDNSRPDLSNSSQQGYIVRSEALMITKDFNFVLTDLYVEWRVTDPVKYLYASDKPVDILRNIIQCEAKRILSGYNVDDALTSAKGEIQAKIQENVNQVIDEYDIGITASNITIQDIEPPSDEVSMAFKEVENAKQAKDTELNNAKAYANEKLPEARADADKIIKAAEGKKETRIQEANGQVARFNDLYKEYANNKEVTRLRMYLETMEEILPSAKVYIQDPDGVIKTVTLD
jgi:membrane protease subunit HflK